MKDSLCEKCGKFPGLCNSYDPDTGKWMVMGWCCLPETGKMWIAAHVRNKYTGEEMSIFGKSVDFMGWSLMFDVELLYILGEEPKFPYWDKVKELGWEVVGGEYIDITKEMQS